MKIGFDAKRAFHNFRGLGNYSRTLIESLSQFYGENEYFLYTPDFKSEVALNWQKKFPNFNIRKPGMMLNNFANPLWRSYFLSSHVASDQCDIYHGLSHELPYFIKNLKAAKFVTIHDLIFLRYPEYFSMIDRQVYKKKINFAIENADVIVAICEQTKNDLIQISGADETKIKIVHQSCNPNFYEKLPLDFINETREQFNLSEHYLLNVGALEPRKNALSIVKAFARLKDKIPHDLVLVGGPNKEYLKKINYIIEENHLAGRVKFLGHVDTHLLPALYQGADLFLYPAEFEGWGIPNVEALFSETPVITSNTSSLPESSGPHSIHVSPHEIEEMANAIELVLFNDQKRDEMIRTGREYAENFHWKNTAKTLMDLYKSYS